MNEPKTWCAECGPEVEIDEDGCCQTCGVDAIGAGADAAHRWRDRARRLKQRLQGEVNHDGR